MPAAPLPPDEEQRLQTLDEYELLDTAPEPDFDGIVALAANLCDTPIALFSLVDEDRQWFKSRVGLESTETNREVSFCAHAVHSDELLVAEDAKTDARFLDNALVLRKPHIRFYAGVPVHAHDLQPLGTLCVIDHVPRSLSDNDRVLLRTLARELEGRLEIRRLSIQQRRMTEERAILMNMIVHDARGVLASMGWSLKALRDEAACAPELLDHLEDAHKEMTQLCEGGAQVAEGGSAVLPVVLGEADLKEWFELTARRSRVAAERAGQAFDAVFELAESAAVTDTSLLDRIVQNLCLNAIQTSARGARIIFRLREAGDERFVVIVEDDGPGIPEEHAEHIFTAFFSGRLAATRSSGLGLAFCRLAAQALGGTIEYSAREPKGARFTVSLPYRSSAGPGNGGRAARGAPH